MLKAWLNKSDMCSDIAKLMHAIIQEHYLGYFTKKYMLCTHGKITLVSLGLMKCSTIF